MSTPNYQTEAPDAVALLQLEIAEELRSRGVFADVPISVDEPEVLGDEVDNAVQTAGGLLFLVEPPTATNTRPAVIPALTLQIEISVLVLENVELNRAPEGRRKPALACAVEILRVLHGFRPRSANVMLQGLGWEFAPDPRLLSYRAKFRTELVLRTVSDRVERPSVP